MATTAIYQVQGMTCGHCVSSVSNALADLPGVNNVSVDLTDGKVTVSSEDRLEAEAVRAAIDGAGYTLVL